VLQGGAPAADTLTIRASSEGTWADQAVQVAVVNAVGGRFNLFVRLVAVQDGAVVTERGRPKVLAVEGFRNLSMDPASPDYVVSVVSASAFVEAVDAGTGTAPQGSAGTPTGDPADAAAWTPPVGGSLTGGDDGTVPTLAPAVLGDPATRTGLRALDAIAPEVFNLLCLPVAATMDDPNRRALYDGAVAYCVDKRAFLLVDIPALVRTPAQMVTHFGTLSPDDHSAVYFPRVIVPDPLNGGRPRNVGASGTMAGVYARTDSTRGVWKAPAGTDALLRGATLASVLTDGDNGGLNPLGINVLRNFPVFGNIAWGARTLAGADQRASEWKYIPVRRTALFIEESLFQALKWVVFEPNDEPLWAQIRLTVGAFLNDQVRLGAFQGRTPREAYFVKCDHDTTTQNDINRGVVNVVVGFAPLIPAEFVVLRIQQIAGQVQV
jgi:phage tail sheath protein FI